MKAIRTRERAEGCEAPVRQEPHHRKRDKFTPGQLAARLSLTHATAARMLIGEGVRAKDIELDRACVTAEILRNVERRVGVAGRRGR